MDQDSNLHYQRIVDFAHFSFRSVSLSLPTLDFGFFGSIPQQILKNMQHLNPITFNSRHAFSNLPVKSCYLSTEPVCYQRPSDVSKVPVTCTQTLGRHHFDMRGTQHDHTFQGRSRFYSNWFHLMKFFIPSGQKFRSVFQRQSQMIALSLRPQPSWLEMHDQRYGICEWKSRQLRCVKVSYSKISPFLPQTRQNSLIRCTPTWAPTHTKAGANVPKVRVLSLNPSIHSVVRNRRRLSSRYLYPRDAPIM